MANDNSYQKHDVIGVGNPFIDHIIEVDENFVQQLKGQKGGMVAVDYDALLQIIADSKKEPVLILGGSGANTIRGLAHLGHHCGLLGSIGKDALGMKFLEHLHKLGITSFLVATEIPTAQVVCMVTPEGERTMRSFLGSAGEMRIQNVDKQIFQGAKLVHIEGYSLMNRDFTQSIMQFAKSAGAKISFDLGSFEVVKAYKDIIKPLLAEYVDLLFANREEIYALTQLDPEQGCDKLRKLCPMVVALMGKEGSLVGTEIEMIHTPAFEVPTLDTTGAGDLFASGFIHGYLKGSSIKDSARFGALIAAEVVQVKGVNIPIDRWEALRAYTLG